MTFLARDPRLTQVLLSLAILAGSYLAARLLSGLLRALVRRITSRTSTTLDDHLARALRGLLTFALFLPGAYFAVHRLPLDERWMRRLDGALFVVSVLVVALAAMRSFRILVDWYAARSALTAQEGLAREFAPLFGKLGTVFIVLVALITVLQHFAVNVSSLVVSLGVGSLAIGLAAQDTLSNMFAGFTLMLDRPFQEGERIRLATGEIGDVQAIGMRATRIKTLDDTILVVPNNLLVRERLVNMSRPARQLTTRVEVGVAYGTRLERAKEILAEAALRSQYTDRERAPLVLVTKFGDFSVNLLLIFWVLDYTKDGLGASEVREEVYRRFAEEGIEIPLPTSRVFHENVPPEAAREA